MRAMREVTLVVGLVGVLTVGAVGCARFQSGSAQAAPDKPAAPQAPLVRLPPGFEIEKVVDQLTFPSSMTWDDQGRMYVAEAGGGLEPMQLAPSRILRVEQGRATPVVDLTGKGVETALVGLTWYRGAFYITHRDAKDQTGAVSRVTPDGQVTRVLTGILDSQAEHQVNDIKVGPDGRMYLTVGHAANSAVVGEDIKAYLVKSPMLHTTECRDIVLTGRNFETPDYRKRGFFGLFRPKVLTGAYVPYATPTTPGQVIKGTNKCGGAILAFDPQNAEGTVRPYAWGFRNVIGIVWDAKGQMYAAMNGYDIRGARPVQDQFDATYRVREGAWYGWPDFSAGLEPLTDPKFAVPKLQAPVFVAGKPQPKQLGFLIDHAASGLTPPDRSLIAGLHEFHASPAMLDVAPAAWGEWAGQLFVAEWGDLAPSTDPLFKRATGSEVVRIDPASRQVVPFARNLKPGPAAEQGAQGQGLEHPFDVKFGPDGAMYIVDYGAVTVTRSTVKPQPKTGVVWKVTREGRPQAAAGR